MFVVSCVNLVVVFSSFVVASLPMKIIVVIVVVHLDVLVGIVDVAVLVVDYGDGDD